MIFADAKIFWMTIWVVPAIFVFLWLSLRAGIKAMDNFAERDLVAKIAPGYSRKKIILRMLMDLLAVIFLITAIARPQWGFHWKEIKKEGLDITFAIDTSRSMLASDFTPNRLEFAKNGIRHFVNTLSGDRVALIAFAGDAFLQCPLTADYRSFFLNLDALTEESIPQGGTALASAIDKAVQSYEGAVGNNRILIMISDGEDNVGDIASAINKAKDEGIMISTIGIGSLKGEMIPILDEKTGKTEYLSDKSGKNVVTKLDEKTLQVAADATGGLYVRAAPAEFGLEAIKNERLSAMEPEETENKKIKIYSERFRYPLGIAIFLLLAEFFLRISGRGGKKDD